MLLQRRTSYTTAAPHAGRRHRSTACKDETFCLPTTRAVVPATADRIFEIILGTSCQSITWIHGDRAIDLGVATKLEAPGVDVFAPKRAAA